MRCFSKSTSALQIYDVYLKYSAMSSFIDLDGLELLDRDLTRTEPCSCEIARFEFRESLTIESGFQLLQNISEFC